MGKREGIIVFTKNRLETLSKTLHQLTKADLPIIVLDSSTNAKTKRFVNDIAMNTNNIYYHGRGEQKEILQKLRKLSSNLDYFIKPLCTPEWNLGYARNYAIILAKAMDFERVIFSDDDILVGDKNIVFMLMKRLNNADFVGAKIVGMPDNSLIEHLMIACGEKINYLTSGGFLAFNLNKVTEYFLNHYNEDQIWLYLHSAKCRIETFGEVEQLKFDPFKEATKKALSQQFGEILRDGVVEASERNDLTLLLKRSFWYEILNIQINYIRKLKELCKGTKVETIAIDVCNALMEYHSNLCVDKFINIFIEYFSMVDQWRQILKRLNETDPKILLGDIEV